jgi:FkbM family methyltransferase
MELPYRAEFPYTDPIFTRHINKPIKTIVEIGCNKFQYTYNLLEVYNPEVLYAFEACPRTAVFCNANITDSRLHFISSAVSNYDGEIDFYGFGFGEDTTCSSVFERVHLKELQEPKTRIPAIRLDTFFKNNSNVKVDLVCMDIQGSELMALQGLGSMINSVNYIMLELPKPNMIVHKNAPTNEDFFKFFHEKGFKMLDSILENSWEDNVLFGKM